MSTFLVTTGWLLCGLLSSSAKWTYCQIEYVSIAHDDGLLADIFYLSMLLAGPFGLIADALMYFISGENLYEHGVHLLFCRTEEFKKDMEAAYQRYLDQNGFRNFLADDYETYVWEHSLPEEDQIDLCHKRMFAKYEALLEEEEELVQE